MKSFRKIFKPLNLLMLTLCICVAVPAMSNALDITSGVPTNGGTGGLGDTSGLGLNTGQGTSGGTGLINQGVGGNNSASNLGAGGSNVTNSTSGGGGGGGAGGQDSAVAALSKVCGNSVTTQDGKLQVFSVGVKCFENIVNGLAQTTIVQFSTYLQDIVYSALIIYLILFGSKVSLGMNTGDQIKKEFMIHALKIAFVAWLIFSFGLLDVYNLVLGSYYSLIGIVLSGAQLGDCSGATGGSGLGSGTDPIWATMDCMLTKFVGWESTNGYGTQYKNVPLFFGIIFSKMLPANGFMIGGILFSALWALVSSFFRLAFIYILSMIALILLFAIAPMIIPMLLFKRTYIYFDGWVKLVVSMVLQPVILFAFFGFVASMMSKTITDLENLYAQLKPAFQTSKVDQTGDTRNIHQTFDMLGDALGKLDPQILINGVSTLVVAYLLISFINYVSAMALELAGAGSAPNLGGLSQDMFNKGF